jgi:ribosomal protein S18 acetylase RimI-like enzyme
VRDERPFDSPRALERREYNEAAVLAARAFYTDPFFVFLGPPALLRNRGLTLFFRAMIRQLGAGAVRHAVCDPRGRIVGAAAWLPTGRYPASWWRQVAQLPGLVRALYRRPQALVHGLRFLLAMEKNHPKEPHWYLFMLVTDPEVQRRGVGTALLEHALAQVDAEGVPAYLETQKEDNLAYYRRFGFELVNTLRPVQGGPALYAMRRPAR